MNRLEEYHIGSEIPGGFFASRKPLFQLAAVLLTGLTVWVWFSVLSVQAAETAVYFLDVGQGDSQLITLASRNGRSSIKILIDGGRGRALLSVLDAAFGGRHDTYIDVLVMTHPHLDHYGGFIELVRRYDIGLFVSNGHEADAPEFMALKQALRERGVPALTLSEGDVVRYGDAALSVISPDEELAGGGNTDEASFVAMLEALHFRILFTGDIGFPAEQVLLEKNHDLAVDVLKVGHHGSKNSSGENFIAAVRPLLSVIGVGSNRYGHPAPRVLKTLELAGSLIHRTDEQGTIKVVFTEAQPSFAKAQAEETGVMAAAASILTGTYKDSRMAVVSLPQLKREERAFDLVASVKCSFASGGIAARAPVIINEVAWMGAESGATHEWIELKNISATAVTISGWQLLNGNERIHITFPQQSVLGAGQLMLLARTAADTALGLDAEVLFSGAIRNSNEGLRLFDNECNRIDEVLASPGWPAGNNSSKRTMERMHDLSWANSENAGGTPGAGRW